MNTFRMRWANKSKDALPPFDKMKWLLTVAGVALHNQLIREVLEAWSLAGFGHVFLNGKVHHCYILVVLFVKLTTLRGPCQRVDRVDKAWCLKSCKRSGGFSDGVREHSRMAVVVLKYKEMIFVFYFCSLIFFLCRNDQLLVGSMVQELIVGQIERPIQDPRCFVVASTRRNQLFQ